MILDAATVLVLRDTDAGPEVFMVRRHQKASFMANAWVYPGGRLDAADTQPGVVSRVLGAPRLGAVEPTRAIGLYLAAIRETFEEAGILLARRRGEPAWVDLLGDPDFLAHRVALHAGSTSLSAVADAEDLEFPLDELCYFAHWVTPTFEPRRFDTFFFLARAPQNQEPLHDALETTDSFWIRPTDVLDRFAAHELFLAPPTQRTLEDLARFACVEEAFAACAGLTPPCIIPHLGQSESGPVLLLPGDPDYPHDDPAYADATPVEPPTRMPLSFPG